jgi:hypothetical protein
MKWTNEGITNNQYFFGYGKEHHKVQSQTTCRSELLKGDELVSIQGVVSRKVAVDIPQHMELKIVRIPQVMALFIRKIMVSHGILGEFTLNVHLKPGSQQRCRFSHVIFEESKFAAEVFRKGFAKTVGSCRQLISPYAPCLWHIYLFLPLGTTPGSSWYHLVI